MAKLSDDEVRAGLAELAGWDRDGDVIAKTYEWADFKGSVGFVVRMAFEAEAADHHPDLDIRWNKVRVALSTHSEGGLTAKDLDLARTIEGLATAS